MVLLWLPRLTAGGPCAFEYTFEQEGPTGQQEGPTCDSVLLTLTVSWVTIV